jgi:hypothetical protein
VAGAIPLPFFVMLGSAVVALLTEAVAKSVADRYLMSDE